MSQPLLNLVLKLTQALEEDDITYCHWKSNNALDRSASGDNDLDLLVSRKDERRFSELLHRLGFKRAQSAAEDQLPGVVSYFGYDFEGDKWVHVHTHYQLVLGQDMTKNYRLALEKPYLESAVQNGIFKTPPPEFEFVVFVIRMMLKHATWDAVLSRESRLTASEGKELAYLQERIKAQRVNEILKCHLPYLQPDLFNRCVQSIQPSCSAWMRVKTAGKLLTVLQANARRPLFTDIWMKLQRRAALFVRRRLFKQSPKYHLESGGAMIAVVGGDGAGKSTVVDGLHSWLSQNFETTRVHMGKPAWSLTTITVRGILKLGQLLGLFPLETSLRKTLEQKSLLSPGYPWLIREACRARDRYWTYIKARRFAANGGLVLLDRFPLSQIRLMDGLQSERFLQLLQDRPPTGRLLNPKAASRLARYLVRLEESYYQRIVLPELLFVLRVQPEHAVQRKPEDDPIAVHERSVEIWSINWATMDVHIIDADQSKAEVLAQIKAVAWEEL